MGLAWHSQHVVPGPELWPASVGLVRRANGSAQHSQQAVPGPELWPEGVGPVPGRFLAIYMQRCVLGRGGWLRGADGRQINLK
jgi:hypothetical protein